MKKIILIIIILSSIHVYANFGSASRKPNETVQQAYLRNKNEKYQINPLQFQSAYSVRKAVSNGYDTSRAQSWFAGDTLELAFDYIRDLRFIEHNKFLRRLSWLYPDDGCFIRAELAIQKLAEHSYPIASKLFIFGELKVLTPNSRDGFVEWWYHVVPVYNLNNQLVVVDPSVSPTRPLKVEEFVERINANQKSSSEIEYSICSSHTITPFDDCNSLEATDPSRLNYEAGTFLEYEWLRLESLGRLPEKELGDFPPWLTQVTSH